MTRPARNTICLWYDGGATMGKIDIAAIEAARRG